MRSHSIKTWAIVLCFSALQAVAEEKSEPAGAGRAKVGEYVEVDEKGKAEPRLRLQLQEVSPNIIAVRGINGWIMFASYDETNKEYRGFFEWQAFGPTRNPGGKWSDLYQVRLITQADGKLLMAGKSKANDFTIRAEPQTK